MAGLAFALTGVAGFVAPRHLEAIRATGHRLVAAVDPHDAAGVLDRYFPEAAFFTEIERFDRHLEKLRRGPEEDRVRWVSVCAPNHLHDAHVRLALRIGASALCEKPLVLNPWNLDLLAELEAESEGRVYTVLQLRHHPALGALRARVGQEGRRHRVVLTYVTPRGRWYAYSWKGDPARSGGIATNIGVHLFDLLLWLFGPADRATVHLAEPARMAGTLELAHADVAWFLSTDRRDLPPGADGPHRTIEVDGETVAFGGLAAELHTRVYEATLAGAGCGIEAARPAIELAYRLRTAVPVTPDADAHPLVRP